MPEIRPYTPKDFDEVRSLCVVSSGLRSRSEMRRMALLKSTCDYYLECEPQCCFVAVGDSGAIEASILCSENFDRYVNRFKETYLPAVEKYGKSATFTAKSNIYAMGRYATYYPAHFRIDILPTCANQGEVASALLDTLSAHLVVRGVRGLMIYLDSKSKRTRAFYNHYGFDTLISNRNGIVLGLDIGSPE